MLIAALRGRSFGRGLALGCCEGSVAKFEDRGVVTGFDFWASCSVTLTCGDTPNDRSYSLRASGGLVSFTCGIVPAIEVSGTPAFRGGGGRFGSRDEGWYAVLVWIFRFDDMRTGRAEEKVRRTCWQGWRELAAAKVNLKRMVDDDVNGAISRCADILIFWKTTE
jgi:hypothetical protein